MKVLDAGTEPMSNVDVLNWMKDKRKQHAEEDAADKKKGKKPSPRPENFMRSLKKHETALKSNDYPYTKNPTAYAGKDGAVDAMTKFDTMITEKICFPLEDKYRGKGMTIEELDKTLGKEQEEKSLTEPEHLMIMNLAPQCVEMLQPMIENVQDRFTAEEQQIIVDCIIECYRCDEVKAKAEGGEDEGVMVGGDEGVEEPAEDDAGAGATEMGQLEAGMREMSPYSSRAAATSGEVAGAASPAPGTQSLPEREDWAFARYGQQSGANASPLGKKE